LLVLGVLIMWRAARALRRLKKYEFENRSDGGVVGFNSYDASRKHSRKKMLAGCAVNLAILFIMSAVVMFIMMN